MKNLNEQPTREAAKPKLTPPEDPAEFEAWRRSLYPDVMGPDNQEVSDA